MAERPILFSAPMVRAILEGRKTVTRRVVKLQPSEGFKYVHPTEFDPGVTCWTGFKPTPGMLVGTWTERKAPYRVGDRLYVREAHALEHDVDGGEPPHADGRPVLRRPDDDVDGTHPLWTQAHYRATDRAPDLTCQRPRCAQCRDDDMGPHWRPGIHMPKWATRIWLEVTAVRVERLQDISEQSAWDEGVQDFMGGPTPLKKVLAPASVHAFADLWETINGDGSWAENPWVWVVAFRRIEGARS